MRLSTSQTAKSHHSRSAKPPFFIQKKQARFFKGKVQPFIQASQSNATTTDSFEVEADRTADQVVSHIDQHHSEPAFFSESTNSSGFINGHSVTPSPKISPVSGSSGVQKKDYFAHQEVEMDSNGAEGIQRKPLEDKTVSSADPIDPGTSSSSGAPMDDETKSQMESGFGQDFSHVNIHTDSSAVQMSKDLNAQAFTYGSDIYFNDGKYNPSSNEGKHLLAHELTHTVQQTGGIQAKRIQKKVEGKVWTGKDGKLDMTQSSSPQLTIANLRVPTFKKRFHQKKDFMLPQNKRSNRQASEWDKNILAEGSLKKKLINKVKRERAPELVRNGKPIYYLKMHKRNVFIIGDIGTIVAKTTRPFWTREGAFQRHHVDHKEEYQLGGADLDMDNLWMLDESANTSSGSNINNELNNKVKKIRKAAGKELGQEIPEVPKSNIKIARVKGKLKSRGVTSSYTEKQIQKGHSLKGLNTLDKKEVKKHGVLGSPSSLVIFTNAAGGGMRNIPWEEGKNQKAGLAVPFGHNFKINSISYKKDEGGTIIGTAFEETKKTGEIIKSKILPPMEIKETDAVDYGGYISKVSVQRAAKKALEAIPMSPIILNEVSLDPIQGLVGNGKIHPSIPIIANADLDISIRGNDVIVSKTFSPGDIDLPYPFEITNTSLSVFMSTRKGFGIDGQTNFKIASLGEGFVKAGKDQSQGFNLLGELIFDSNFFEPAKAAVSYKNKIWDFSGTLGVKENKIKGLKSAQVNVRSLNGVLHADGKGLLDIPKVNNAEVTFFYSPATGMIITGDFEISDTSGIQSSKFNVVVGRNADGKWVVSASGYVIPKTAGLQSAKISGTYLDGLFTLEATKSYKIGILSGDVTIGVTNRTVDEEGNLVGEPGDNLVFYGDATLEAIFASFLKGTAKAKITPSGDLIISGGISLPKEVDLTKKKWEIKPNKLMEFPTVEVPIAGIRVLGKGIGIFATFGGRLEFAAGLGPLKLKNLNLNLENFDPKDVSTAKVTGGAALDLPAYAKLSLIAFAGVGVDLLIVEITGKLNGGASMVLEGNAGASVNVEWSKSNGLQLKDAQASLQAQVKLLLELFATVDVDLDLLLKTVNVYHERFNLKSFEYASGLNLGIKFPVTMENNTPKEVGFGDLDITRPPFDSAGLEKMFIAGVKEGKKPKLPPPPNREEVIKKLKRLDPDGFVKSRWWYVFELNTKYPEVDWSFIPVELKKIENEEARQYAETVREFPDYLSDFMVHASIISFFDNRPLADQSPVYKAKEEREARLSS